MVAGFITPAHSWEEGALANPWESSGVMWGGWSPHSLPVHLHRMGISDYLTNLPESQTCKTSLGVSVGSLETHLCVRMVFVCLCLCLYGEAKDRH